MDREQLIAKKSRVQREIHILQRQISTANMNPGGNSAKRQKKQIRGLEGKLDKLMAEEANLRIQIDKAPVTRRLSQCTGTGSVVLRAPEFAEQERQSPCCDCFAGGLV